MNEEIASLNQNLMEMNDVLELRVDERTADLTAAHQKMTEQYNELVQMQDELINSQNRLLRAQSIAMVGDWEFKFDSGQIWASPEAFRIYGIEQDSPYMELQTIQRLVCKPDRLTLDKAFKNLIAKNEKYDVEFKIQRVDNGLERSLHSMAEMQYDQDGNPEKIVGVVQDITERKRAQEALGESEARYRAVIEQAPEAVVLCDPYTGDVIEANSRFTEQLGYDLRQNAALNLFELIADEPEKIRSNMDRILQTGSLSLQRRLFNHQSGGIATVERSATLVNYRGRSLFVMTLRDVSDEVRREQEEYYHATHDELTGLYNRRGFAAAVSKNLSENIPGTLLLVGIDDFKLVNDVHGHVVGDKYLAAFGAFLNESFGETALATRFGGDEFILFFAGPGGLDEATTAIDKMGTICLETETGSFIVQISGGISLFPEHGNNLDSLMQRAYLALHHTKKSGKSCYTVYESELQNDVSRRYAIKEELNGAIANGECHLVFQPIFDIQESREKIVGYEALLRWSNPRLGEVMPAEFIPLAEETNQIISIGKWVLREACLFAVNFKNTFGEFANVAVNISMRQLAMPDFVEMVKDTLRETGLPACNLCLEVTESILMTDSATRVAYLHELRDCGIAISLDDFGTGYSSFTYLAQMPITTLKIDKSLVDEIMDGGKSLLLMESLLHLSALLGFRVVAEGVETQEQLFLLRNKGCGYCQGYYLSRPLREIAVNELMKLRKI